LNNGSGVKYQVLHEAPATGENFYRIRGEEKSGSVVYSEMQRISRKAINDPVQMRLSPVPLASDQLHVELPTLAKGNYKLEVYNTAGQ
jgi:hypothetical protein